MREKSDSYNTYRGPLLLQSKMARGATWIASILLTISGDDDGRTSEQALLQFSSCHPLFSFHSGNEPPPRGVPRMSPAWSSHTHQVKEWQHDLVVPFTFVDYPSSFWQIFFHHSRPEPGLLRGTSAYSMLSTFYHLPNFQQKFVSCSLLYKMV